MIATITTSTVTTVTTIALASSLTLVIVLMLLFFMVQKEILTVATDAKKKALSQAINIAIVPLLISFVFIAVVKVAEVLN